MDDLIDAEVGWGLGIPISDIGGGRGEEGGGDGWLEFTLDR